MRQVVRRELSYQDPSQELKAPRFKTKPYKHQLKCLNEFGRRPYFALLAEMGTGKTWIIINNMADLWASGDLHSALVLAPNGVHSNLTRLELPKHMPDWCPYRAYAWTSKKTKAVEREMTAFMATPAGTLRIFTMNWDALQSARGRDAARAFARSAGTLMIVCDESDAVKNPKAERTKALMSLRPYAEWRRIMTGTPITNSPFDVFSQFSFLDSTILQTTNYWAFKAEYAEMLTGGPLYDKVKAQMRRGNPQIVARGPGGRPQYRNLDKLARLIAPHSFRVRKEDCLDLPEKIYKTILFDLTSEQRKIYRKAKNECRLAFEGEDTPFNKLAAFGKLAQITSGYYLHPNAEEPVRIEGKNPKIELAAERIKAVVEQGEQIIVWARYRAEIADLAAACKKLELEHVLYYGDIKPQARQEAIDAFQSGEAPVFIANPQSGGTGITLTAASFVLYFSNSFSLRERLQSEDRAHRIGQDKPVTYLNLAARGTIDEKVIAVLTAKQDVASAIVDSGLSWLGDG